MIIIEKKCKAVYTKIEIMLFPVNYHIPIQRYNICVLYIHVYNIRFKWNTVMRQSVNVQNLNK